MSEYLLDAFRWTVSGFLWAGFGVAAVVVGSLVMTLWGKTGSKDLKKAARVLERHGMTPQFYLPAVGEGATELRDALEFFAMRGYIITNEQGEVVGKICPRPGKGLEGPHLRLVVSNPKTQEDENV